MSRRKQYFIFAVALLAALTIGVWSAPLSYPESLIRIQAAQRLEKIDPRIADEPLAVQALLLDYAGKDTGADASRADSELPLKAWIALQKYPEPSRQVLQLFGSEPKFRAILREHGESVIPVIKYFLDNDLKSVQFMSQVGKAVAQAQKSIDEMSGKLKNAPNSPQSVPAPPLPTSPAAPLESASASLTPVQQGWYAINAIASEGHKFLGQFSLDSAHVAHWNQVDRSVTNVATFLTGGLSNLERKYELDEAIGGSDVFFATIDVIPFVAAVKLLKAGKVVSATGKELGVVGKTRLFAARLIPKNPMLVSLGKYGMVLATGYVILRHPALLNSLFGDLAKWLDVNPVLIQFIGWFLLISVALYPFLWVLKIAAKLLLLGFSWLERPTKKARVTASV